MNQKGSFCSPFFLPFGNLAVLRLGLCHMGLRVTGWVRIFRGWRKSNRAERKGETLLRQQRSARKMCIMQAKHFLPSYWSNVNTASLGVRWHIWGQCGKNWGSGHTCLCSDRCSLQPEFRALCLYPELLIPRHLQARKWLSKFQSTQISCPAQRLGAFSLFTSTGCKELYLCLPIR